MVRIREAMPRKMLQGFVDKLIALWNLPPDLDGAEDEDDLALAEAEEQREFGRSLSAMATDADHGGKIMAGTVTVVGLEGVRALIGDDWDAMAAQVERITASVLARLVRPPDFCTRHDADNVLICFATPNKLVAEQRAGTVARALEHALNLNFGGYAEHFHVDHFVAEVTLGDAVEAGDDDVAAGLLVVLQRIRDNARLSGKPAANGWMKSARLQFQPLWEVRESRTGANRCVLDIPGAGATLGKLEALDGSPSVHEALARIDFVTLTRAAETLHAGAREHHQATLLVPVHFQTLEQRNWRSDYLRMAAMLPAEYRKSIQVEILGLPEGTSAAALAGYVNLLDVVSPWVVLQLSLQTAAPGGLGTLGLAGFSFNFAELGMLRGMNKALAALVHSAESEGLASYAVGVNTIGQAETARDAGFAFIGGSAIHPTSNEPRSPVRFAPLPQRHNGPRWLGQLPTG
jgi:hypothetical protein